MVSRAKRRSRARNISGQCQLSPTLSPQILSRCLSLPTANHHFHKMFLNSIYHRHTTCLRQQAATPNVCSNLKNSHEISSLSSTWNDMFNLVDSGSGMHAPCKALPVRFDVQLLYTVDLVHGGLVSPFRLSPRVALNADSGSSKKANDTMTVPGSSMGKLVMSCASVSCSFCPKCTRPATEIACKHCLQCWQHHNAA